MQEIFEKIIEKLEELKNHYNECCLVDYNEGAAVGLTEAMNIVRQAAAEDNNGWIPCSERLPAMHECQENDCRFIVTDGNRRYQAWFNIYDGCFEIPRNRDDIMREDKCVIAWQHLPVPYKPKED